MQCSTKFLSWSLHRKMHMKETYIKKIFFYMQRESWSLHSKMHMKETYNKKILFFTCKENLSTPKSSLQMNLKTKLEAYSFSLQYPSSTMQSILVLYTIGRSVVFLELYLTNTNCNIRRDFSLISRTSVH